VQEDHLELADEPQQVKQAEGRMRTPQAPMGKPDAAEAPSLGTAEACRTARAKASCNSRVG
jgi:hypothetical protein